MPLPSTKRTIIAGKNWHSASANLLLNCHKSNKAPSFFSQKSPPDLEKNHNIATRDNPQNRHLSKIQAITILSLLSGSRQINCPIPFRRMTPNATLQDQTTDKIQDTDRKQLALCMQCFPSMTIYPFRCRSGAGNGLWNWHCQGLTIKPSARSFKWRPRHRPTSRKEPTALTPSAST